MLLLPTGEFIWSLFSFTRVVDKHGNEIINAKKDQIKRDVFKESTALSSRTGWKML